MSLRALRLAALVCALAAPAGAAPAVILSGEAAGVGPGGILDDAVQVEIPAGAMVMFNDAGGVTRTLVGPYAGPLGADPGAGGGLQALVAAKAEEDARLGAIRAAPGEAPPDPWLVSVAQTATQCIPATGDPVLWRPESMDADSALTITPLGAPLGGGAEKRLVWHAKEAEAPWPADLPVTSGASYRVALSIAARPVAITLHRAPQRFGDDREAMAWMAAQGCRRQALALLARLGG